MERTASISTPAKVFAVLVALLVALAFVPTDAYAASSKTVKKAGFTSETKVIEKKATKVTKGTTKLTFKKGEGFIKFKATKTKKYSFTFSNLKGKKTNNAYITFKTPDKYSPEYSWSTPLKTKGGKSETLWLSVNGTKFTGNYKQIDKPIVKRTGTIKLKKGQMAYFYFYSGNNAKTTATLKIK